MCERKHGKETVHRAKQDPKGFLLSLGVHEADTMKAFENAVKTKNVAGFKNTLQKDMEEEAPPP